MHVIPRTIERHFLLIAVVLSAAALIWPPAFTWIRPHIPLGLGVIMFGMGLTLEFEDFRKVFKNIKLVGMGAVLQFAVMPLLAVGLSRLLGLPLAATIGMVVVGACPGGTASNVVAHLAKANVALSVTMTLVSTCLAPLLTPLIIYWAVGERVEVEVWPMIKNVFWIVVFPLVDGLILRRLFRRWLTPFLLWFPSLSIVVIALLIACIIGLNQQTLLAFPLLIFVAVALHNLGGLAVGYGAGRLLRCEDADSRTLAIEVGMQNSGLGVALASTYFGAASALPGALFSLWHNVSGITLAGIWRKSSGIESG